VETPDLFSLFVRPVHQAGWRYMVSGSLASVHYGEPRLTMDVDLAVHLPPAEIEALAAVFPPADYYVPPLEVAIAEVARPVRGHFNVIHLTSGQKADFYPSRNHPYLKWAWEHRQQGQVDGDPVWFAPREYVIMWKLEFYREGGGDKHLQDIAGILRVSREELDFTLLDRAVSELGLEKFWTLAKQIAA
jgi:hypothetical protein